VRACKKNFLSCVLDFKAYTSILSYFSQFHIFLHGLVLKKVSMSSFVIEKIIGEHVNLLIDTHVRVKWEGYPDSYNSWILKSSLEENSDIEDDGQPECPADRGNFISASHAIANVLAYRSLAAYNCPDVVIDSYYFQKLEVKKKDYLLIWNYNDHLYVICAFRGQVWSADGVDHCHINSKVRGLVR